MNPERTRPARALAEMPPDAWRAADYMIAEKGKPGAPDWPDWCLLPVGGWLACAGVSVEPGKLPDSLEPFKKAARFAALGSWRYCQSVYQYHPGLYEELMDEPFSDEELPVEVLLRLPECCPYIATPGFRMAGDIVHGVYVYLDYDMNAGIPELRMTLDLDDAISVLPLPLAYPTLRQTIDAIVGEAARMAPWFEMPLSVEMKANAVDVFVDAAARLLPLVVYLCTDKPEMYDEQARAGAKPYPRTPPRGVTARRAPAKPRIWRVGMKLGRQIRAVYQSAAGGGGKKSPHVRRGHRHKFWVGSHDGERRLIVKYLPPMDIGKPREKDKDDPTAG
ncbi:MAG: hypothetical protein LBT97_03040 [Planctomycetota bacterium]|jgi:hypothetical protein|nr:hypothetical protein [Planctomycetota bacterium]